MCDLLLLVCGTNTGIDWQIKAKAALDQCEHDFIKNFCPEIWYNDSGYYLWAFNVQLPSGRWLENIRFSSDLKTATAYIN